MLGQKVRFLIVFILFLFSCPWFLILIQNHSLIINEDLPTLFSKNQVFIDETNTLRGETIRSGATLPGKLFVNKFTIYGQEMTKRYLESFDPNYLFFTGGINKITSTGDSGQLPLSFLPLILYSILTIYFSKKYKYGNAILLLFILSPIFSIIFYRHYEWVPKILFFLIATVLASFGLTNLPKTKKWLLIIFITFWIYETVNFYHKFENHYIRKLAEQIYNIKK